MLQNIINMTKLFIGIAILGTPHGFSHAGLFGGIFGLLFVVVMCIYTISIQAVTRNKVGSHVKSYSELGHAVYGTWGKAGVDVFSMVGQVGIGIAYLIFNGKTID